MILASMPSETDLAALRGKIEIYRLGGQIVARVWRDRRKPTRKTTKQFAEGRAMQGCNSSAATPNA